MPPSSSNMTSCRKYGRKKKVIRKRRRGRGEDSSSNPFSPPYFLYLHYVRKIWGGGKEQKGVRRARVFFLGGWGGGGWLYRETGERDKGGEKIEIASCARPFASRTSRSRGGGEEVPGKGNADTSIMSSLRGVGKIKTGKGGRKKKRKRKK